MQILKPAVSYCNFHLYEILEQGKLAGRDRKETRVAWGRGKEGIDCNGSQGHFWSCDKILYLVFSVDYIGQNLLNCTIKISAFVICKLYSNKVDFLKTQLTPVFGLLDEAGATGPVRLHMYGVVTVHIKQEVLASIPANFYTTFLNCTD